MRNADREIRFMAARDATSVLSEVDSSPTEITDGLITALIQQLWDTSREVSLNAQQCLERLYSSANKSLKGTVSSFPSLL